jgi:putative PIG3 family NAD(P)H quinone oxidoreductase
MERDSMATLPPTMRAIDPDGPGGPEVMALVERPVPEPGEGEVLIKVEAAGVNRPDLMQRIGAYPPPPGAPTIPGLEVAGRVVGVGAGVFPSGWMAKRVCALVSGGGYAEYCTAPTGQCLNVPGPLSMVEGAALPEAVFTVWSNLFGLGGAKRGDTVLVHGGTSGIGTTAILLGRLFELKVIVTAGSDEKCARAVELGAAYAINYRSGDFVEAVKELTEDKGVQVVLDMVGGDYLARNLACLAEEGRHVSIAAQRGALAEVQLWTLMRRRLTLTGSTLRARSVAFKSSLAIEIQKKVWPFLETGRMRPVIDTVFPLARAARAHQRMEDGKHVGKIVLEVLDPTFPAR